ncbi:hypothetical protein KKF91_04135 [Myxococcota bacterium]|nr:hypothetical protein [Myxococcota bacterium]MBU1429734.1 hypothetical protein [Myxococcota bacterium]MBU1897757.1 hypothetical protein [Myxococcota bacterium]
MTAEAARSKEQILRRFRELQREHKIQEAYVSTKAEEAERAEDLQVVKQAAAYTVQSVVTELAALQLKFKGDLEAISNTLTSEVDKLTALQRAIIVERGRVAELENIRVAAEALELLNQEHKQRGADFEQQATEARKAFDEDVAALRAAWAREQADFEQGLKEHQTNQDKTRQAEEEEHAYELKRRRELDTDNFATNKKLQDRALAEEEAQKEANWKAREAELAKHAEAIKAMQAEDAAFPDKLKGAEEEAKADAIRKAQQEAKDEAELIAKEFEADVKVFTQEIAALNETIAQQQARMEALTAELKAAAVEEQKLAVKAIDNAKR